MRNLAKNTWNLKKSMWKLKENDEKLEGKTLGIFYSDTFHKIIKIKYF
jgi:hypothetical protein